MQAYTNLIAYLICIRRSGQAFSFIRYVFKVTYIRLHVSGKHVLLIFGSIAEAHDGVKESVHRKHGAA